MFNVDNSIGLVVANNILCLALRTGRIIRIDLEHPETVDDIDLPKKQSETGTIEGVFFDPTGTHLVITTSLGDNYVLNSSSTKPKLLTRIKNTVITAIAWSPSAPNRITGEILIGTKDGQVIETVIEPSNEYFKKEERYVKTVWSNSSGRSISGVHAYESREPNTRHVIVTSAGEIWHWKGKILAKAERDAIPVYQRLFDKVTPERESFDPNEVDSFALSPYSFPRRPPSTFGWLTGVGVVHSSLKSDNSEFLKDANLLLYDQVEMGKGGDRVRSLLLTEYYLLFLQKNTIIGINRLNNQKVFEHTVPVEQGEELLGLCSDHSVGTFWAYSERNIYEIKATEGESKGIWKTMLECGRYEEALDLADDATAKDAVRQAYGDELLAHKEYERAAFMLGLTSKPLESCSLVFLDAKQYDALLLYLKTKLKSVGRGSGNKMQRIMLSAWIAELFMEKMNSLEDKQAVGVPNGGVPDSSAAAGEEDEEEENELLTVKTAFRQFIKDNKASLDKDTLYEIMSTHNRRDELLYYADAVDDGSFVLSYWTRTENWAEALKVLLTKNSPELTYRYATVLLMNSPEATVDAWMRISDLDPAKLVPALLNYVSSYKAGEQAIRYLKFAIDTLGSMDTVIHNALILIYASSTIDEQPLLKFLQQTEKSAPGFDFDFALRVCTQFNRIKCSVSIYTSMGLYEDAVKLALRKNDIDLAARVADTAINDEGLRKSLWLEIAKKVISSRDGFEKAIELLDRSELLKIEDLLPFVPDFTTLNSEFKNRVTESMEGYNAEISQLNREMEETVQTVENIRGEITKYKRNYALVEPGEGCGICEFPLITRRFYVFPCQHAFHSDCLVTYIKTHGDYESRRVLNEATNTSGFKDLPENIDQLISKSCVLCNDTRIDSVDEDLVSRIDDFAL
ncbi:vacuolar membrane protein Pep3p [Trichomonascus vanleenenianus]|uniref:tethering complex subunit PEP3 n=1 Tax=Trichomonascus vanleenenianus TaxID=2268995 RepID=UPI003EC9A774